MELPAEDHVWSADDVKKIVESEAVVVFGKGEKNLPQCGYSNRAYEVLKAVGKPFEVVNIFRHESIRAAVEAYSDFNTMPQLFVGGKLIGGSDIALEEYEAGTLQPKIEAAVGE